jgi:pilus assembly protein CpaF
MIGRFGSAKPHEGTRVDRAVEPALPPELPQVKQTNGGTDSDDFHRKFLETKMRLHHTLIEEINLAAIEDAHPEELRSSISEIVRNYVLKNRIVVNNAELNRLVDELIDEMTGLGPIEPLLKDDSVNDILINTHENVYVERHGILEPVPLFFKDEAHLLRIINKIVAAVGRRVDESQPLVDARLADGSRVNVAIRPIAVDGPLVSIRKFSKQAYSLDHLVNVGSIRPAVGNFLAAAVSGRISILVSGGTGSGKTTMLNALSQHISHRERLITIEDAAELQLQQPHVGRMETRLPSIEGTGEIRQRELLKNALRMRPDRIIVGEVRGEEAFDMLQAMNTGHEGSMTTIHANTARDALSRLEQMIGMAGMPMSQLSVRAQIASAIQLVVQLQRMSDGKRRLVQVAEITGMESDVVQTQTIFEFKRSGTGPEGEVLGELRATGLRPKIIENLELLGFAATPDMFDPTQLR